MVQIADGHWLLIEISGSDGTPPNGPAPLREVRLDLLATLQHTESLAGRTVTRLLGRALQHPPHRRVRGQRG